MEAMAFTYIVGVFAMMALGGLGLVYPSALLNPGVLILMEFVRAWRLLKLVRRYE